MKKSHPIEFLFTSLILCFSLNSGYSQGARAVFNFNKGWNFRLNDTTNAEQPGFSDANWRRLNLPHDWSIEGTFSKDNPSLPRGGALPGGIGWYRKTFLLPQTTKGKRVYIDFDGVYQKSTVWINGHHLGFRPNGYISFRYELTPYLHFGNQQNTIAVKVDNSTQPNSRWYSGSGIYRNVWLITTGKIAVNHWGTNITTPIVNTANATIKLDVNIKNASGSKQLIGITTRIMDAKGKTVALLVSNGLSISDTVGIFNQQIIMNKPHLWSVDDPYLYKVITVITHNKQVVDIYKTPLGVRYFNFDANNGFFLNGKPIKILGVCEHHDLGSLGAAFNTRAMERKLQLLKVMGCNAIRTSHNPPAPELLDLCDKMGFIVMDEAFDCWERKKTTYDYHLYFKQWHKKDLEDQVLRDRNHPSVIMWSVGNEIPEQSDTSAYRIATDLADIIHHLDITRPILNGNNHDPDTEKNMIIKSGAFDLIGYNYHQNFYASFPQRFPGAKFISSETTSALETRGFYDMPSDSIRRWPLVGEAAKKGKMNDDYTVSAYDNVASFWGSTHEESWKIIKKYPFMSGTFIWTGFDYLGEPTPYSWPARSASFGILDLAGFPKDIYYMYQSEWTTKPVLHIFPHWNWEPGKIVDIWAYYNNADEVGLYLNGKSVGIKKKAGDDLHVMWRLKFTPGTLKAVSRKNGKVVLTREIYTAGLPARIELIADRKIIKADGDDLCFVTVKILDKAGNLVPDAINKVNFSLTGNGTLAAVDNGDPISHDPFKASYRKAFYGLALAIIKSKEKQPGAITLTASADGLAPAKLVFYAK